MDWAGVGQYGAPAIRPGCRDFESRTLLQAPLFVFLRHFLNLRLVVSTFAGNACVQLISTRTRGVGSRQRRDGDLAGKMVFQSDSSSMPSITGLVERARLGMDRSPEEYGGLPA